MSASTLSAKPIRESFPSRNYSPIAPSITAQSANHDELGVLKGTLRFHTNRRDQEGALTHQVTGNVNGKSVV
ncbi:hypothetical protein KC358_g27 [Hortaea werneckii]|nr:hypothetical protein KC358_g27 [Hortaea werneckii]